ncbi:MAG: molybdenum cofactor biosynthesis protein MoaE [Betaproteobacteria bacterium AqS2]|uniref:Molybdopterin synthase catalytic subunit n=1 Tax=Candidatus Amphirhobacter heronislandensis TaxID=1732024 RepID=A0A930UFJ7_9GAMM|nr:molybdenum cofactor biosynthesis protein MoaE [Betaproteobacteria bacterium AqS2]
MSAAATIVELREQPIDPAAATAELEAKLGAARVEAGAAASFAGTVRAAAGEKLESMFLEHYPGMTEKQLVRIASRAAEEHGLAGIGLWHRHGLLRPLEVIVFVHAIAAHRQAAFAACGQVVDYLKTDAPFWKKETGSFGERWVAPRAGEEQPRGE